MSSAPFVTTDVASLRGFLAKDPVNHLYLLGVLDEHGLSSKEEALPHAFWAREKGGELTSVLFVGGDGALVLPSASDPAEISAIAAPLHGKMKLRATLGEKSAVDAVLRQLGSRKPRLNRVQRLFQVSADDLGPFTNPTLRLAGEEDLPDLLPLAAGAVKAAGAKDPLTEDPQGFRARVLHRIRNKRTYVLWVNQRLVFKVDVGSRSQYGAELEGMFTVEGERRKGHATLSLGQICRHLLSSLPRLVVRIDEENATLAGVARKVGFTAGATQRWVVVD